MTPAARTLAVGLLLTSLAAPQAYGQRAGRPGTPAYRQQSPFTNVKAALNGGRGPGLGPSGLVPTRRLPLMSPPTPLPRSTLFAGPGFVPTPAYSTYRPVSLAPTPFVAPVFVGGTGLGFNYLPPLAYAPPGLSLTASPAYAHPLHLGFPTVLSPAYPVVSPYGFGGGPAVAPYAPTTNITIINYPAGAIAPATTPVPLGGGLQGGFGYPTALINPVAADVGLARHAHVPAGVSRYWTRYVSPARLNLHVAQVRRDLPHRSCFTRDWYAVRPGAWRAPGGPTIPPQAPRAWPALAEWSGLPGTPAYFDYGNTLVYRDDRVIADGMEVGRADERAARAIELAEAGRAVGSEEGEWKALGVFALVRGEETTSDHLFDLALNGDGVLRGNYYNALTDTTLPLYGRVDKKTQKAAWTLGEKALPVFETGLFNLTREGTPVLVHYGKENTQQWTLVRVERPADPG